MAKDEVTADVNGLQTSNSTFSSSPPGSLIRAEECVMPQKGVVEPRRGQLRSGTLASATTLPFAFAQFGANLIINSSTSKAGTSYALSYQAGFAGSVTAFTGTFNPVDTDGSSPFASRMKFAHAAEFLHFCTTTGAKTLEPDFGQPRSSGLARMPDALCAMASASILGSSGEGLEYGSSRAYRTVLRLPTSTGVSLLSPPSGRFVVTNRLVAPIGGMVRTGGNLVTVTFNINQLPNGTGLSVGDSFTLTPGEANFAAGAYVVLGFGATANIITYTSVGANVANTVAQDFDTGPRPVYVQANLSADAVADETPVRIYRSTDTTTGDPSDEMYLVNEKMADAAAITAGYVFYYDVTPESVINDPLYTNPLTGEGARSANFRPPLYRDVSNFGSQTFYANTTGLQQFRLQMLGVGTPDGIQNNDTITIGGDAYTFKTTIGAPGAGDVLIVSSGTPSYNISQTTQNLIAEIHAKNIASATGIEAYYESAQNGAPGKILLEATSQSAAAFGVIASRPETWTPALDTAVEVDSVAERTPNGLAYSKPSQPESVPVLNYTQVGSKNFPIGRIIGLRQALLVFKEGDGVWTVTGAAPFNIQQISDANIIARDVACQFADSCWVYTDQGIMRISDSGGATVVSRAIETDLNELQRRLPALFAAYSFVVPYEQERRILFFMPFSTDNATGLPVLRAWCYNSATQAWTGPLYSFAFAGLNAILGIGSTPKPSLLLGVYDSAWATSRLTLENLEMNAERESEALNYTDAVFSVTISAIDVGGDSLVVQLSSMTDVAVGDALLQGISAAGIARVSIIAALRPDVGPDMVELMSDEPFTAASAFIAKHYDAVLQFQPQGSPTTRKTLTRLSWLFKPEWFGSLLSKSLISTDQVQADAEIDTTYAGFGMRPFGEGPFGDPSPLIVDVNPIGAKWANAGQFFFGMTVPVCFTKFKLQGFSARLESADAPVGRGPR